MVAGTDTQSSLEDQQAVQLPLRRGNLARRFGYAGVVFLAVVGACAAFAPWLAPADPVQQDLSARFAPPVWAEGGSADHILGADALGRDTLSRLIYGARVSLGVSISAVALAVVFGTLLGLLSGYLGGRPGRLGRITDRVILAATEMTLAIPGLILAIAVVGLFGATVRNLIVILALFGWVVFTRLTRGIVMSLHRRSFVEAAVVLGASPWRVVSRHMLPYVLPQILIVAALQVGFMILVESALSFLGLGVQPPTPTWGGMVAEGRTALNVSPWGGIFSGLVITATVLSFSFVADLMRERISVS